MRIVSLLPAATEIVCALGLADDLVGVSHACDYPPAAIAGKAVVTRSRLATSAIPADEDAELPTAGEIDAEVRAMLAAGEPIFAIDGVKLRALQPDLVLTQGLCDACAMNHKDVVALAAALGENVTVLDLTPTTLDGVLETFRQIGAATNRAAEADALIALTQARWETVRVRASATGERPKTLLLEWPEPPFSVGHWNPELLALAHATAAPWDKIGQPSRTLDAAEIAAFAPEMIVLFACGFDAYRALDEAWSLTDLPGWFDLPAVRNGECYAVDGNAYFNRPGPRLAESAEILATVLHPEAFTEMLPPYSVQRFPDDLLIPSDPEDDAPDEETLEAAEAIAV